MVVIKSVSYRRLVTLPNFCNHVVEATAVVEDDETPENALGILRGWVDAQLAVHDELKSSREQLWNARQQLLEVGNQVRQLEQRKRSLSTMVEQFGAMIAQAEELEQLPF